MTKPLRITLISDTHKFHRTLDPLPPGDILIHAGDLTARGRQHEIEDFADWLKVQPYTHKVIVAGNHDFLFEDYPERAVAALVGDKRDIHYLHDRTVEIEGLKIYGTPWQPWFYDWAFNVRDHDKLARIYSKIPAELDILVTHCPPYGILDLTLSGEHVGSPELLDALYERKIKLNVFGHIHEAYGIVQDPNRLYVNASICTRAYKPTNLPIHLIYKDGNFELIREERRPDGVTSTDTTGLLPDNSRWIFE